MNLKMFRLHRKGLEAGDGTTVHIGMEGIQPTFVPAFRLVRDGWVSRTRKKKQERDRLASRSMPAD
jgi:hypothetical protein